MNAGMIAIFALIALLASPNLSFAGEWTGYQIIVRPDGAQAHYLQLNIDSRKLCKMQNKAYFNSLQVNCPSCKVSFESCDREIRNDFKEIIDNKILAFPYISKKKDRLWFTGMPLSENSKLCRNLASQFRSVGYPARCIE